MTGENEHERESAGDSLTPEDSVPEFDLDSSEAPPSLEPADQPADEPVRTSRRFRAWGAAQAEEKGPSLWSRTSAAIKKLFTREKPAEADVQPEADVQLDEAIDLESEVPPEPEIVPQVPDEPEIVAAAEEHSIPIIEAPAEEPQLADDPAFYVPPDEPKEDLKFLRTSQTDIEEVAEPDVAEPQMHEGPTADMDAEPVAEVEPEPEKPKKRRASLLKRVFFTPIVFGPRKPKVEEGADEEIPDTGEHAIPDAVDWTPPAVAEEPPVEVEAGEAVESSSLDEALPMDAPSSDLTDLDAVSADMEPEAPVAPKKPGFFARLFGRKAAEDVPVAEEIAPEAEVDAVAQLDAVDEGFEVARSEFAPQEHASDESFATVDDALPLDAPTPELSEANLMDATMDAQPAVTEPFELPSIPVVPPPAAPTSDEHSFFGGNTFDFDTPKADDRATMEVAPVDDRKTAEVTAADAAAIAHADEEDRKTDEFELIELDGGTLQEPAVSPLEGKTAEVPKVSIFKKLFSRTKEVTQVEPAVAPPPSANPTFLVQKFRTFYNEVVVYKNQKAELTAGFATAIVTSYDADLSPEQAANSLSQRLQQMLELQLAESSWMGGEIQELYPNAQYAMACLADEMLSNMEWPGQAAWGKHRLELTVFKTAASDLELFKRIDKLLKNGPQTVGTRDLSRVYLLAIASGFKGKYRPFDLPRALAEYRRRLYEFVYGGDALMLYADERRIFPEATSVTVAGKGVKRFSMAQQWAAILVLLLAGYTVISHLAWKRVSADLKDIAGRVEQARNPSPPEQPNGGGGR